MITITRDEARSILITYIRLRNAYINKGNMDAASFYVKEIEKLQDKLHNNEYYTVP